MAFEMGFWALYMSVALWINGLVAWNSLFPLDFSSFSPWILRDETDLGRGVHRFWGVWIQKSRSLFGPFFHFCPNFGISGVGVV